MTITRRRTTNARTQRAKVITQTKLARIQNRYSERLLHVPADLAVIIVSLEALVSMGLIVLIVAAVAAAVAMIVFTA